MARLPSWTAPAHAAAAAWSSGPAADAQRTWAAPGSSCRRRPGRPIRCRSPRPARRMCWRSSIPATSSKRWASASSSPTRRATSVRSASIRASMCPPPDAGHKPEVRRHRLIFWPQTRTPYVLLVNRRDDRPAPVRKDQRAGRAARAAAAGVAAAELCRTRTLAAYYDKPLVAENFSATEAVDPISRRGPRRLGHVLRGGPAPGADAAARRLQRRSCSPWPARAARSIPAASWSRRPKYDSGVFFESGQDPIRKDVLELLFRLCDRSGIELIPAVQFAAPLPAAGSDSPCRRPGSDGPGAVGPDGRTWLARRGPAGGAGRLLQRPAIARAAGDDGGRGRAGRAVWPPRQLRRRRRASERGELALLPDETCSLTT